MKGKDSKEGYSLEVQIEYLESFAKREGYEVYEVFKIYQDDGISGHTKERSALKGLLKDAKDKKFDAVLVYKIDRFSRNLFWDCFRTLSFAMTLE